MWSRWHRVALLMAAVGLVAGCTSTSAGSPTAATTGPSATVSPPAAEGTPSFPPRTREIRLDGLNPCKVWTPKQRTELGLRDEPTPDSPSPFPLGGVDCAWYTPREVEPELLYTVLARPGKDLAVFWGDDTTRVTETVAEVVRFPAIRETTPQGSRDACLFHIGTAEDHVLTIDLAIFPNEYTVEDACALTLTAAEMAIATLQAQR